MTSYVCDVVLLQLRVLREFKNAANNFHFKECCAIFKFNCCILLSGELLLRLGFFFLIDGG